MNLMSLLSLIIYVLLVLRFAIYNLTCRDKPHCQPENCFVNLKGIHLRRFQTKVLKGEKLRDKCHEENVKKTTVHSENTVERVFGTQLVFNRNLWPLRLALESSENLITDITRFTVTLLKRFQSC